MPETTNPAEREPMGDERLAVIRAEVTRPSEYALEADVKDLACELLAEVDRVWAEVAVAWEFNNAGQAAFDAEYATNGQLRAALEELRRQLGEARLEWGVRIFDHDPANATEVMSDKAQAREVAACWREEIEDSNPTLMQRTMRDEGQWQEADDDGNELRQGDWTL